MPSQSRILQLRDGIERLRQRNIQLRQMIAAVRQRKETIERADADAALQFDAGGVLVDPVQGPLQQAVQPAPVQPVPVPDTIQAQPPEPQPAFDPLGLIKRAEQQAAGAGTDIPVPSIGARLKRDFRALAEHRLGELEGMRPEYPSGNIADQTITLGANVMRNLIAFGTDQIPQIAEAILNSKSPGEALMVLEPFITFPVHELGKVADGLYLSWLPNYFAYGKEVADKAVRDAHDSFALAPEGPALGIAALAGGVRGAPKAFEKAKRILPQRKVPKKLTLDEIFPTRPKPVEQPKAGLVDILDAKGNKTTTNVEYPTIKEGQKVDGRVVSDKIEGNVSDAADAAYTDWESLSGTREVSLDGWSKQKFSAADDVARVNELTKRIAESGEITPVIVGIESGNPVILEGAHRVSALQELNAKSFPAKVVVEIPKGKTLQAEAPKPPTISDRKAKPIEIKEISDALQRKAETPPIVKTEAKAPTAKAEAKEVVAPPTPLIKSSLESRGVKGDRLLDALDLVDDLKAKNAEISSDGIVTLYHRTSKAKADVIVKTGQMVSKEDRLFFGTHAKGQIEGYGDVAVKVRIPLEKLELNDVFSREAHVTMKSGRIGSPVKIEVVKPPAKAKEVVAPKRPSKPVVGQKPPKVTVKPIGEAVGLNKREIADIRDAAGLEPTTPVRKKKTEQSFREAKAKKLDRDALEVAGDVLKTKRAVTDAEHAGMVLKAGELERQLNAETKIIDDLISAGRKDEAGIQRGRRQRILDDIDNLTQASDYAGTEAARAMSIRRMRVNKQTYDLVSVLQRARTNRGKALSERQTGKLETLTKEHTALQERFAETEKKLQTSTLEQEWLRAEQITRRISTKKKVLRSVAQDRVQIKKDLAELGFKVNDMSGVTAEGAYLIGKLATSYIHEGITKLPELVKRVRKDVPELTDLDVYRSLNARNPKLQARARTQATLDVAVVKKQARLMAQIADAEQGVFAKGRKQRPQPAEIQKLQKTLQKLRTEAYKSGRHPQQLDRAVQTITELQEQLAGQFRKAKEKKPVVVGELAIIRTKIAELRKFMRTEDTLARLQDQLRTGEFEIPKKMEPVAIAPELERLQIQIKKARQDINNAIDAMAPLTPRKILAETVNTLRTAKATADASGTLRQGFILFVHDPKTGVISFGKAIKAAFNEHTALQIDNAIRSRDGYFIWEKAGLELTEFDGALMRSEEMFLSNVLESKFARKIIIGHIVRGSNRHMTTVLNLMRSAAADGILIKYPNATPVELRVWANYINLNSGRGNLGRWKVVANELSLGFFAPRFAISRIQTPILVVKALLDPATRRMGKEMAKDMAKVGALGVTALGLAKLGGAALSGDPRDSDYGKMRFGNTRIDMWGGFQQPMRVLGGLAMGLTGDNDVDPIELVARYAKYKGSPLITGPLYQAYTGKDIVGREITPTGIALEAITPIIIDGIIEAYKLDGLGKAALAGGLEFLGVSTGTYKDSQSKTRRTIKALRDKGDLSGAYSKELEWNIQNPANKIRIMSRR